VSQLEPSRLIGAEFPVSLLAATKLVGAVGIEPTALNSNALPPGLNPAQDKINAD
jgi:hypothetical protein